MKSRICHCPLWSAGERCKFQNPRIHSCIIDPEDLKKMYNYFKYKLPFHQTCNDTEIYYSPNTKRKTYVIVKVISLENLVQNLIKQNKMRG